MEPYRRSRSLHRQSGARVTGSALSPGATLVREFLRLCVKPALRPQVSVGAQRWWTSLCARALRVPRAVRCRRLCRESLAIEIVAPEGLRSRSRAILYFHGGAGVIGSPMTHRTLTSRLALGGGLEVWVPAYRLAPEHPFPAALDDALTAYRALRETGLPGSRILLAGDSMGGGLALSLALRLRDLGDEEEYQVAGLLLLAPWVDLALSRLTRSPRDPLLSCEWLTWAAAAYAGKTSTHHPAISPLNADLRGLPPVYLQSSGQDLLYEDARRLACCLAEAGVDVVHDAYPELWHVFQLCAWLAPEAAEAVGHLIDAAQSILAQRSGHGSGDFA